MFKIRYQLAVRQIYFFGVTNIVGQVGSNLRRFCLTSAQFRKFGLISFSVTSPPSPILPSTKLVRNINFFILFDDIDLLVDFVDLHFIAEASPHDEP